MNLLKYAKYMVPPIFKAYSHFLASFNNDRVYCSEFILKSIYFLAICVNIIELNTTFAITCGYQVAFNTQFINLDAIHSPTPTIESPLAEICMGNPE